MKSLNVHKLFVTEKYEALIIQRGIKERTPNVEQLCYEVLGG